MDRPRKRPSHRRSGLPPVRAWRIARTPGGQEPEVWTPENRYWTGGYPHEVKLRLSKPLQERFHILKQGQKLVLKPG